MPLNNPPDANHQPDQGHSGSLERQRVAFVGRLAGMSKREAQQLVRKHGGVPVDRVDAAGLIVVGEYDLPTSAADLLDEPVRQAAEQGTLALISETQLWQRLGFVEGEQNIHRLYTPGMLADLLRVPVAVIRCWHRRGLIVPVRLVHRLAYFDFQEVATARRLAELLAAGISPQAIEKKLAALRRLLPGVERPLAQLSVIVEGKELLLRQGDGLIEPGGQLRFDFEVEPADGSPADRSAMAAGASLAMHGQAAQTARQPSTGELRAIAVELDEAGQLAPAAEMYRAALVAGGPDAEVCFLLAELLYRLGDLAGARERYYMAIELHEDFVEARANLGCVLAETGQHELAAAAFEGALAFHHDYPDVHYHLARTLEELGRRNEAEAYWRTFLELAADSPWAAAARVRLAEK